VVKVSLEELQTKLISALRKAGLQIEERRIDVVSKLGFRIVMFDEKREEEHNLTVLELQVPDFLKDGRYGLVALDERGNLV